MVCKGKTKPLNSSYKAIKTIFPITPCSPDGLIPQ